MITNVAYSAGQRAALSSFFKEAAGISPITMAPPKLRPGVRPAYGAPGVAPSAAAGPSGLTNTHIPTPTPLPADGLSTRASLKPAPRQMSPAAVAAAPDVTQVTKNQKPFATGPIPVPAGVDRTQVTQNQKPFATGPIPVPPAPAAPAPAAPAPAAPAPAAPAPAASAEKAQPTFMQSIREQAPGALLNTGLMMGIPMAMQAMSGSNNQNQN